MKRFYRQRKNATNKSSKSRKKSKVVAERLDDGYSLEEKNLREFDMDMTYGPCLGLTRLERWERAHKLGLNPPQQLKCLLQSDKVRSECLWYKYT
ncbi:DNA polymerase delta subunit 4 [Spatholobus suberectus]|nr:DNA polymerase delta subunit 4 [Spatholobus suberectus]